MALPITTSGCRALFERRVGSSTFSGSSAVRGLRGVSGRVVAPVAGAGAPAAGLEAGGVDDADAAGEAAGVAVAPAGGFETDGAEEADAADEAAGVTIALTGGFEAGAVDDADGVGEAPAAAARALPFVGCTAAGLRGSPADDDVVDALDGEAAAAGRSGFAAAAPAAPAAPGAGAAFGAGAGAGAGAPAAAGRPDLSTGGLDSVTATHPPLRGTRSH